MISCARKTTSTTCANRSASKLPSGRRNFIRLIDARLQAESSTCMYSEQGLDALIRPDSGEVCHRLMIVSYCTPGSAQRQAASAISRMSSRAATVLTGSPGAPAGWAQPPPLLDGGHEVVGDAHRVVGVLVLDRVERVGVDPHVEPGVA